MTRKYKLTSGKIVEFELAPVETGLNLFRTVVNETKGTGLKLEIDESDTVFNLIFGKNADAALAVMGSENVFNAVCECCTRVKYDNKPFTLDLFNDEKARQDLLPVIQLVGLENLAPFFPSLRLVFDTLISDLLMK